MNYIEITKDEAAKLLSNEGAVLLDVRMPEEFSLYRVEGKRVVNVPLNSLEERADELRGYSIILCICRTNRRSREAARILSRLGFENVYVVVDGVLGWLGLET